MALNGFSVLLLVSAALEVLAELKRAFYTALCPLILRLKLLHNAIENKVYYDLAAALYYFSARSYRRSQGGEEGAGGLPPAIEMPPKTKRMATKPIIHSAAVFFLHFCVLQ